MTTTTKPKKRRAAPPLEWHAKRLTTTSYNRTLWECKYCKNQFSCYGTQYGEIRQHLRRVHPKQYAKVPNKMYFIEEDAV
jgi:hypothetical protein